MSLQNITNSQPNRLCFKAVPLMRRLETCNDIYSLAAIVATTSKFFDRPVAVRTFCLRLELLKPKMKNRDISDLLNKLSKAKMSVPTSKPIHRRVMKELSDLAVAKLRHLETRDISIVLNATAKQNIHNERLFERAAKCLSSRAREVDPKDISMALNAFARMNFKRTEFLDAMADEAISAIRFFDPQNLSLTACAFAKFGHHHPALFDAVAKQSVEIISNFDIQSLCATIDAFAQLDHRNKRLLEVIASAAISFVHRLKAKDLSCLAKSYARLQYDDGKLFDAISEAFLPIMHTVTSYDLSNVVAAFAHFGRWYPILFEEVASASILSAHTFNAKGLEITVNAYAKMNDHNFALFDAAASAASSTINSFGPGNLSIFAKAYATVSHNHPTLFELIEKRSVRLADKLGVPELFSLLDTFQAMHYRPSKLLAVPLNTRASVFVFEADLSDLLSKVPLFGSTENSNCFVAMTVDRIKRSVSQLNNKSLVDVADIFMNIKYKGQSLWEHLGTEITRRDDSSWTAQDLGKIAAAFGCIRTPTSLCVIRMALQKFQSKPTEESSIKDVVSIVSAIPCGQSCEAIPHGFIEDMATLAIGKSAESGHDDIGSILFNFSKVHLKVPLRGKMLAVYWPIFRELQIFISESDRERITQIYTEFDSIHDDESWVTVFCQDSVIH